MCLSLNDYKDLNGTSDLGYGDIVEYGDILWGLAYFNIFCLCKGYYAISNVFKKYS